MTRFDALRTHRNAILKIVTEVLRDNELFGSGPSRSADCYKYQIIENLF